MIYSNYNNNICCNCRHDYEVDAKKKRSMDPLATMSGYLEVKRKKHKSGKHGHEVRYDNINIFIISDLSFGIIRVYYLQATFVEASLQRLETFSELPNHS